MAFVVGVEDRVNLMIVSFGRIIPCGVLDNESLVSIAIYVFPSLFTCEGELVGRVSYYISILVMQALEGPFELS